MRIGLIGNVVIDRIATFSGAHSEGFGGAFYNIVIFDSLMREGDELYPITPVGYDVYDKLLEKLRSLRHVNPDGIYRSDNPNNRVLLNYYSSDERTEKATTFLPPIPFDKIKPFCHLDLLHFNYISGIETTLETVKKVRQNFQGLMSIDIHSLLLGVDGEGYRFRRNLPRWDEWLSCFDIVQMNVWEADTIAEQELDVGTRSGFVRDVLRCGPDVVNVTLGGQGSLVAFVDEDRIVVDELTAFGETPGADPTGCGDAYSAGFLLEYLENGDPLRAAVAANRVAGAVSSISGVEGILSVDLNSVYRSETLGEA